MHHIISVRISEEERTLLEKLAHASSRSVSDLMREAIGLWKVRQEQSCPGAGLREERG